MRNVIKWTQNPSWKYELKKEKVGNFNKYFLKSKESFGKDSKLKKNSYIKEENQKSKKRNQSSSTNNIKSEKDENLFDVENLNKIEFLKEVENLNTQKIQRLSFSGNTNNDKGLFSEYWSVPTKGDGDCFFHALSIKNPAQARDQFCDKVENDATYAGRFMDIVLEHFRDLEADKRKNDIPEGLMALFQENNEYDITRSMLVKLGVNPLPSEVQKQVYHSDQDLKAQISHDDIKKYMAPFKSTNNTFIPVRPEAYCPASALAELAQKRVNIFTLQKDGKLNLLKSILPEKTDEPLINILHHEIHFTRLYNPDERNEHKQQCVAIYHEHPRFPQ